MNLRNPTPPRWCFLFAILSLALGAQLTVSTKASAQTVCRADQIQEVIHGPIKARMGPYKRQIKKDVKESLYNARLGCFVTSCNPHVRSEFGITSYSVDVVGENSSFLSTQQVEESFEYAFDALASLDIDDKEKAKLIAEWQEKQELYLEHVYQIESSHASCRLKAVATGRGTFVQFGSSIVVDARIGLCCPGPQYRDVIQLRQQIQRKVQEDIDAARKKNPYGGFTPGLGDRPFDPLKPAPVWTRWLNRDNPGGTGDFETLRDHRRENPDIVCANPTAVECRVIKTGQPVKTVQTRRGSSYRCELPVGGVCDNRFQAPGERCKNLEVRFACPQKPASDLHY